MKMPSTIRPMTEQEIEFASYLLRIKLPDWSKDVYALKPLLKFLAMKPPMIREGRVNTIYHLLYRYRQQIGRIQTRHPRQFWIMVEQNMVPPATVKKRARRGKTLCEVFTEEAKNNPLTDGKLDLGKMFDLAHQIKEKRRAEGTLDVPEITNL